MRKFFILFSILPAGLVSHLMAQNNGIGSNSVMITTTPEGNVTWKANVDGQTRGGYQDSRTSPYTCHANSNDADVIIPNTTYFYTNQSKDILFFSGNGTDTYSVTILDADGNIVASCESNEDNSMDISDFKKGTYVLKMKRGQNGKTYTKRIVKD
jgi:hypothetical protein